MRFAAAVVAVVAASSPVAGQQVPPLAPGTRVRVTMAIAGAPVTGVVVGPYEGRTDAALVVRDSVPVAIPLGQLRRLEVSQGRKLSVLGGTLGGLTGAAIGFFVVGCLANRDGYGAPCVGQHDSMFVLGAALGGLAGAALGAPLFRRERWQTVSVW